MATWLSTNRNSKKGVLFSPVCHSPVVRASIGFLGHIFPMGLCQPTPWIPPPHPSSNQYFMYADELKMVRPRTLGGFFPASVGVDQKQPALTAICVNGSSRCEEATRDQGDQGVAGKLGCDSECLVQCKVTPVIGVKVKLCQLGAMCVPTVPCQSQARAPHTSPSHTCTHCLTIGWLK